MTSSFADYDVAAKFRDVIRDIVSDQVTKMRPEVRVAQVESINADDLTAAVRFTGDAGTINARFGPSLQPRSVGSIVRIGGSLGNYYITEVLNEAAVQQAYEPVLTDYTAGDLNNSNLVIGGGNLMQNSYFYDSTLWPSAIGSMSRSFEITTTYFGGSALKVTSTSASNPSGIGLTLVNSGDINLMLKPNTTFQASIWIYIPSVSGVDQVSIATSGTGIASASNPVNTVKDKWVRITSEFTTGASGLWSWTVNTEINPAVGEYFIIGAMQLEEGNTPTAYAPRPDEILNGTITTTKIADDAITSPKILAGAVVAGKIQANAIDAMTITGATFQTTATASRGIKMTSSGISAWDSVGTLKFDLNASTGAITANGATITGGTFQTATSGKRITIDTTNIIKFYSGVTGETAPAFIDPNSTGSSTTPELEFRSGTNATYWSPAVITMLSGTSLVGSKTSITGDVTVGTGNDLFKVRGDLQIDPGGEIRMGNTAQNILTEFDFGEKSGTMDGTGQVTVNHHMATFPVAVITTNSGSAGRTFPVSAVGSGSFTVNPKDASGTALSNGTNYSFFWVTLR